MSLEESRAEILRRNISKNELSRGLTPEVLAYVAARIEGFTCRGLASAAFAFERLRRANKEERYSMKTIQEVTNQLRLRIRQGPEQQEGFSWNEFFKRISPVTYAKGAYHACREQLLLKRITTLDKGTKAKKDIALPARAS